MRKFVFGALWAIKKGKPPTADLHFVIFRTFSARLFLENPKSSKFTMYWKARMLAFQNFHVLKTKSPPQAAQILPKTNKNQGSANLKA